MVESELKNDIAARWWIQFRKSLFYLVIPFTYSLEKNSVCSPQFMNLCLLMVQSYAGLGSDLLLVPALLHLPQLTW